MGDSSVSISEEQGSEDSDSVDSGGKKRRDPYNILGGASHCSLLTFQNLEEKAIRKPRFHCCCEWVNVWVPNSFSGGAKHFLSLLLFPLFYLLPLRDVLTAQFVSPYLFLYLKF